MIIDIVHYYRDVWPGRSDILTPMTEEGCGTKGIKIIWNDALEDFFKELKCMVSAENLLNYPDWKIFSLYTQMLLINSWVLLLVRIINLSHFLKEIKQATT